MIQYLSCNSSNDENIDLWQNMKKRMFLAGGTTAIKTRGQGNKTCYEEDIDKLF